MRKTNDLDSCLQRFERFTGENSWPEEEWAVSLSALLSGHALNIYSRLMRWAMILQPFQMKVKVIKGSHNMDADYLSREYHE